MIMGNTTSTSYNPYISDAAPPGFYTSPVPDNYQAVIDNIPSSTGNLIGGNPYIETPSTTPNPDLTPFQKMFGVPEITEKNPEVYIALNPGLQDDATYIYDQNVANALDLTKTRPTVSGISLGIQNLLQDR